MAARRDKHVFKFGGSFAQTATGDGTSEPVITSHLRNLLIQVNGTFEADVSVQTRVDPSLDFLELSQLSAPGFVSIPNDAPVSDVQIVVSNYVSGSIKCVIVGRTAQE
jgi:hypothetical protein